jgi:ABC-2 type transport system permease protein
MKSLTITTTNIRRMVREPSTIFFVFIFPMLLILVIGASFGGAFQPKIGFINEDDGSYAAAFVDQMTALEGFETVEYSDSDLLLDDVERGVVQMGVIIPSQYSDRLRSGDLADVDFVGKVDTELIQYRAAIEAVASEQSAIFRAARVLVDEGLAGFDEAVVTAQHVASAVDLKVAVEVAGESLFGDIGQFDLGAAQELLLFVFLTSLAGSAALIQTRRLGVSRRMVSTPTSVGEILVGETGGRFAVAMIQGLFIMVGAAVAFDVKWGNLVGAGALLIMIALVGAGAGMLMGSLFDNDEQAGSMGVFMGLGLAALGGCMVPIEIFPDVMVKIAHLTPHAWGLDGFAELVRRGGTIVSIGPELAVLAGFAAVFLMLGTWRLRAKLTH